jgi:hypothetical protein
MIVIEPQVDKTILQSHYNGNLFGHLDPQQPLQYNHRNRYINFIPNGGLSN